MKTIVLLSLLGFLAGCGGMSYTPDPASVKQVMFHSHGFLVPCRDEDCPTRWSTSFGLRPIESAATSGIGFWPVGTKMENLNLDAPVIVTSVIGPAQAAGMMVGDQIVERDGVAIKCIGEIMSIPPVEINEVHNYKVVRGGQLLTFQLTAVPVVSLKSMDEIKVTADKYDESKVFDSLTKIDNRVDPMSKGSLYFFHLNICANLAGSEYRRVMDEQRNRAISGAIAGAALGAGMGFATGTAFGLDSRYSGQLAAAGATSGAAAGGIAGAASTHNPVDILIFNCMTNRGYIMLY